MNILKIQNYSVSENIIVKKIDDVIMVYNKDNGDMYEINDVGGEIFEYLRQGVAISEMITRLTVDYDAPRNEIEGATRDFLMRMIELGIVLL